MMLESALAGTGDSVEATGGEGEGGREGGEGEGEEVDAEEGEFKLEELPSISWEGDGNVLETTLATG
jgi:hypothetical protein